MSPVLHGALLVVASAACVAADTILARIVTQEVGPFVLVFFRNLFGLLFLLPLLARAGRAGLATGRMALHVTRAGIKIMGLVAFFYGVSAVPVAEATAIAFATPLFAAVGAALFLGESLRHGRLLAILLGFGGVLIVLRPGTQTLHPAALAVIGSAVALASIGLLAKVLARHDPPNTIVTLNLALSVPLALLAGAAVLGHALARERGSHGGPGCPGCRLAALLHPGAQARGCLLDDAGRLRPPALRGPPGLPRLRAGAGRLDLDRCGRDLCRHPASLARRDEGAASGCRAGGRALTRQMDRTNK